MNWKIKKKTKSNYVDVQLSQSWLHVHNIYSTIGLFKSYIWHDWTRVDLYCDAVISFFSLGLNRNGLHSAIYLFTSRSNNKIKWLTDLVSAPHQLRTRCVNRFDLLLRSESEWMKLIANYLSTQCNAWPIESDLAARCRIGPSWTLIIIYLYLTLFN